MVVILHFSTLSGNYLQILTSKSCDEHFRNFYMRVLPGLSSQSVTRQVIQCSPLFLSPLLFKSKAVLEELLS